MVSKAICIPYCVINIDALVKQGMRGEMVAQCPGMRIIQQCRCRGIYMKRPLMFQSNVQDDY